MNINHNLFTRRLFALLICKCILFFALIYRLFYLQVSEGLNFKRLSEKNRTNLVPILPKRGIIYDAFKVPLAENTFLWEALFIKSQINQEIHLFVNTLATTIELSDSSKERIINDYKSQPAYYPILIKQDLSQSEIAALETFSYNLPGVFVRPFYRRRYLYAEAFAHIVGYTSITDDASKSNKVLNWHIGKYGIEQTMDSLLRGEVGYTKYEVNVKGVVIRKLEQNPSKRGNNLSITLDSNLQQQIYDMLSKYNSASASVIDIRNGNILALASYPSFDPNFFTEGISQDLWDELVNNEKSPLSNKSLLGLYPPGSTIKPIMVLEALQQKLITPETKVECKGYIDVGKDRFHCWKHKGHGKLNVYEALSQSCDVFFYELAQLFKIADMDNAAKNFGFGTKLLNFIINESKGRILSTNKDDKYQTGDKIVSVIGQGKWLTTPLQLANMAAIIANDGLVRPLNILKNIEYDNKIVYPTMSNEVKSLPYEKEYIDLIKKTFYDTVNTAKGTGLLARTGDKNWALAGKTGTSQVRRISLKEREDGIISNHLLPWKKRDHALFVGFVPFNSPKYAISVVIEHGGGASLTAAPLARDISLILRDRDELYNKENEKLYEIMNNKSTTERESNEKNI